MPSLSEVKIFRALCVCLWRTDIDGKSFPVIFFILKLSLTVLEAPHFARLPGQQVPGDPVSPLPSSGVWVFCHVQLLHGCWGLDFSLSAV